MPIRTKSDFESALNAWKSALSDHASAPDGQWAVKGFIDISRQIYTISADTKVVSKILEIHLFPKILEFAERQDLAVVLPEHQNYYPDISFVSKEDDQIRFAVDFKTTYRNPKKPWLCNGFTLGSHGRYFRDRSSVKNIQFPYSSYAGHFCIGIIYDRLDSATTDSAQPHSLDKLQSIASTISNIQFFVTEKWKIASDKRGSGNTANIGSIQRIEDIVSGNGMFAKLGEEWFDDYWMNYGKITVKGEAGELKQIVSLKEFVQYRGGDASLIVPRNNRK